MRLIKLLDREELTITAALRHLRSSRDVELLLCEGGPTLLGSMVSVFGGAVSLVLFGWLATRKKTA